GAADDPDDWGHQPILAAVGSDGKSRGGARASRPPCSLPAQAANVNPFPRACRRPTVAMRPQMSVARTIGGDMSDTLRPSEPVEGEYTDSELPLSAELPKEEYEEVEAVLDDDDLADTDEVDVEVIDVVETDTTYPPDRDTL